MNLNDSRFESKKKFTNNDKFKHKIYKIIKYNNNNSDVKPFFLKFERINIIIQNRINFYWYIDSAVTAYITY